MSASRFVACLATALLITACGPKAVPTAPTVAPAVKGVPQGETAELPQRPQAGQPAGPATPPPTEPFELNGISFTPVPSGDRLGCKEPLHVARPEERDGSPLDFIATYLPPGATMQFTVADSCDSRVASLGTVYTDGQRSINIARWTMRVFRMPSVAPQAVQVAGKAGVRLGDDLLLVEEWGMTAIEVTGLPYEETVRIAEGLRSRSGK